MQKKFGYAAFILAIGFFCLGASKDAYGENGGKEIVVEREVTVQPGKWAVARLRNMADNVDLTVGVISQAPCFSSF
ncbi:MAG: hypothetical protein AB7D07_15140 [Desulfovibrionaceae bacterium]